MPKYLTICFRCFPTLWYTNTSFVSLPQAMYSLFTVRPTKFFSFLWPLKVCSWENYNTWKIKIKLLHYRNYISIYLRSHNDQNPQVEEMVMGRLTYWEIFLYIPEAQWAVSRCRSQFIVGQKFYIWDSFLVPIEHMEWLADISQVVVVNVMICRTHL